ncbi:MAG: hypothetical protein ACK5MU_00550 [Candidatus Saccharimonadales bacterium]
MAEFETDGSSALAPKDPYRGMSRSDTRPNLQVIEGGKSKSGGAKNDLANAEKNAAANPLSVIDGGANEAKSAEQNQAFSPRFTGKGLPAGGKDDKTKKKGFMKGKGPLVAILTLLLGGGGLMTGSQVMMPFATANRIIQEFNSMKTIMSKRSDRILRFQLDTDRYKNPTRTTIFGNDKFKISNKQATKLKTEGIEYMQLDNGTRLLVYDDGSGKKQPVMSNSDTSKLPNGDLDVDAIAEIRTKAGLADGVEINTKAMNIDSAFELDGFKYGYMKSSKTWKGNIAGWFDSLVLKIFDRLGISRNRFKKWEVANNVEAGNAEFKKAASGDIDADGGTEVVGKNEVDGDEGDNPRLEDDVISDRDQDRIRPGDSEDTVKTKLSSKALAAAQAAGGAATVVCAVMAAAGAISAVAVAAETAQIVNFVTGYLEAVQKVQAGDGDGSPMANYTNMLTTADSNGTTGMSAQGIGALFGRSYVDQDDPSVQRFDLESSMKVIGVNLGYTVDAMMGCTYAQIAAGAIDAVADIVMLIGTVGIGNIVKSIVKSVAFPTMIALAIRQLVSFLVPILAKNLTRDLINDVLGEDLGNAIASGGNIYLGKNHQGGGGSPGDTDSVLAYRREAAAILAEEAEYDRATRSPFDTSSQNTFLGSLLYSLMPLASSTTSMSFLANLGSLTTSSLTSLLPTASAVADTQLVTQQGYCPTLQAVGVMGDAYCNPYYTSDLTTADYDPGEVVYETVAANSQCDDGNFKTVWTDTNGDGIKQCDEVEVMVNDEENPVINLDSNLGKYIVFCGQRDSSYGMADANISAAFELINTGSGGVDAALSGGLSAVPVIGGLADIAENVAKGANSNWIGGKACVASDSNPDWKENRYYQRYVEDQRLMESAEIITKSSVTIALEEYYEENPIDNSYEGILARYAGMTTEDVIAVLDLVEYAAFIAEYDPSGLAPVQSEPEDADALDLSSDVIVAERVDGPVLQHIIYFDNRGKYYTV